MHALDYFIMDVFTRTALEGNPLAVVMDTVGLSTERMQAVAREFNLSETTFVQRRPEALERAEGVRVRIFTTQEELPFAGHPTLGTASVLKLTAPETVRGSTVTLALNAGPVPVEFDEGLFGEMTQRAPEFGAELEPERVARLTGVRMEDLDLAVHPQVVSTGTAFAIVALRSLEALARLKVRQEEATDWLRARGARWFYVLAPGPDTRPDTSPDTSPEKHTQGTEHYRARMQFNGGEDPATGSAAGCAISLLVARCAVASGERILLRQGVEIGRPSDLYLSARSECGKVSDVRVAGSTVLVAKGQFFLP
jgi:trans-2,3-dihydro-3-hydroxyanthranilate isomerase